MVKHFKITVGFRSNLKKLQSGFGQTSKNYSRISVKPQKISVGSEQFLIKKKMFQAVKSVMNAVLNKQEIARFEAYSEPRKFLAISLNRSRLRIWRTAMKVGVILAFLILQPLKNLNALLKLEP